MTTDSGNYKSAFDHAQQLLQTGQFELAHAQAEAILDVHPKDAKTHYLRAAALRRLGRLEEAV